MGGGTRFSSPAGLPRQAQLKLKDHKSQARALALFTAATLAFLRRSGLAHLKDTGEVLASIPSGERFLRALLPSCNSCWSCEILHAPENPVPEFVV